MSEKSRLTNRSVEKLVGAGVAGDYRCAATRGLVLRVKGSGVFTWNVRRSRHGIDHRIDLGNLWTLDEARDLANEVDRRMRADLEPWMNPGARAWAAHLDQRRRDKLGLGPAPKVVEPVRKAYVPSYSWPTAVDLHHAELTRTRRDSTAYSYRADLRGEEMRRFELRDVKDITRQEVAEAIADIHKRGAERKATTTAVAVRSLYKFLGRDDMTRKTGVEHGRMKDLRAPENTFVEGDDDDGRNVLYVPDGPSISNLVKALRRESDRVLERDRLAGMLAVYTVQRRRAVTQARVADFERAPGLGGLWKLPPLHRKTASMRKRRTGLSAGDHVIPLPPSAWAVVDRAMALAGESEWLFPGTRARRAGMPVTSMSPSTLSQYFREIAGNLASPHDLRRAFATTYAAEARLTPHDVKTVLDHNEGVASGDVTRQHYMFLTGEAEKWPLMRGWCEWVDRWAARKD